MFSKKEKYQIRDNKWRSVHVKYMYTNLLKSSIQDTLYVKSLKRAYLKLSLAKNNSPKRKNLCLLSSENSGVDKNTLLSRFQRNNLSVRNKLQNFKLNSW